MSELKETSNGKTVLLYFPESLQLLQQELIHHHQDLILKIAGCYPPTIENQLAKLGMELEVVLDGDYDIGELALVLLNRLYRKRGHIILKQ